MRIYDCGSHRPPVQWLRTEKFHTVVATLHWSPRNKNANRSVSVPHSRRKNAMQQRNAYKHFRLQIQSESELIWGVTTAVSLYKFEYCWRIATLPLWHEQILVAPMIGYWPQRDTHSATSMKDGRVVMIWCIFAASLFTSRDRWQSWIWEQRSTMLNRGSEITCAHQKLASSSVRVQIYCFYGHDQNEVWCSWCTELFFAEHFLFLTTVSLGSAPVACHRLCKKGSVIIVPWMTFQNHTWDARR